MMTQRQFHLFGTVHIESDDSNVPRFRSQRTMALLGYLVTEQRPISRDVLAALFWPDEPQAKGRSSLRRDLYNLSRVLPDCWATDRQSIQFTPSDHAEVDLLRFLELEQAGQWAQAAAWAQGEFLKGLYLDDNLEFETWLLGQRERWRQHFETVLARLIDRHSRQAHYHDALRYAHKLLRITPWNEEVHLTTAAGFSVPLRAVK